MADLEASFWRIFKRTIGIDGAGGTVSKQGSERWDSLRHVELVFELEEEFGVDIPPDDIVALYSNTDVILDYLRRRVDAAK